MKVFATGVAALAIAVSGMTAGTPAATIAVQPVVFGVPMPLDPPPAAGAPLPTTDEVSSMLTRLTDAAITYKEKGYLVENGINQGEGHALDHDLRKASRDGQLPYTFNVTNVEPTGPNQAVANVTTSGPKMAPVTQPIQLVDQGSWVLSHDSALALIQSLPQ